MRSIALLTLLAVSAFAQDPSANETPSSSGSSVAPSATPSAGSTSSSNPFIPSSVSTQCQAFLTSLNTDAQLDACTAPLLNATSSFGPSASITGPPITQEYISSTLDTLCSSATVSACPETLVRTKLSEFYSACTSELSGSNPNLIVKNTYDVLYVLTPLRNAVCTKDANTGSYCVLTTPAAAAASNDGARSTSSGDPVREANIHLAQDNLYITIPDDGSNAAWGVYKRQELQAGSESASSASATPASSSAAPVPTSTGPAIGNGLAPSIANTTAIGTTGLAYLFIHAGMDATSLCTSCTSRILTTYARFESSTPYGPGLANSAILGTQGDLWRAVTAKCGNDFMTTIMESAGAAPTNAAVKAGAKSLVALAAGAIGLWALL